MTALVWDELPGRRYEAGVSHGALYLPNSPGVVWNGLISVDESFVGGEESLFHLDGVRYLTVIEGKHYQGSINAFYFPREFAVCLGEKPLVPGIRLTNQPKSRFNFSYQTHYDEGYKIHLVYNVLATPTNRSHQTEGSVPNPTVLSWTFDATPVAAPGFKPSAHYVIDSTKADLVLLNELESTLYGTAFSSPEFPTIEDLVELFSVVLP